MVLTNHVADHASGFLVRFVPVVAQFAHGEQHPPMHRFQAIAHVRQRPPDDHAHGVIEVGLPHFVFQIDRQDFFGDISHAGPRGIRAGRAKPNAQRAAGPFETQLIVASFGRPGKRNGCKGGKVRR